MRVENAAGGLYRAAMNGTRGNTKNKKGNGYEKSMERSGKSDEEFQKRTIS
jgi:hypothetical protein